VRRKGGWGGGGGRGGGGKGGGGNGGVGRGVKGGEGAEAKREREGRGEARG